MSDHGYVAGAIGDGSWFILYLNGKELLVAPTLASLATKAMSDLMDRSSENDFDFLHDIASDNGQMLGNVKHMRWFRDTVTEALLDEFQGMVPSPQPTP
jgi:hypothetical protein